MSESETHVDVQVGCLAPMYLELRWQELRMRVKFTCVGEAASTHDIL